jgi:hypothetical protein
VKNSIRQGIFFVVMVAAAGCSGKPSPEAPATAEAKFQLRDVYDLLVLHEEQKKRPAKAVQDLQPYDNAFPTGFAAIREEKVLVSWGAATAGSEGILAYEKKTPSDGGWVVLQGGTVKELTAEAFKAAPKAEP